MIRPPARPAALRQLLIALSLSSALTSPVLAQGVAAGRTPAAPSAADRLWREGDAAAALAAANADPAGTLLKAELLDAAGRVAEATPLYRQVRATTADAAVRQRIDLRLAILDAVRRPDALTAFAADRSPSQRRALAEVLALLGRPGQALALAGPATTPVQRLTAAQWALAAGDAAAARSAAQAAVAAATPEDRRYALALLVEAYRMGGDLAGVLPILARQGAGPATDATIDVLLELGRTSQAIALIARSGDPAVRARLGGILDQSGDIAAAQAEYRRLIAADPHQADLYTRLAAAWLAQGREDEAVATFRALFAANRGRADVLTAGAKAMIAMGLHEPAVAMLAGSAGDPAVATATHLFLFETRMDRGDTAGALAELAAVRRADPRGLLLTEVADGYERLGRPAEALALLRQREARGDAGYDLRAHIAQLASATGDDADALARWRALWSDTTLPARRSAIERQIVALATRLDRIEAMAADLSTRLDVGTLRPGEIDLLVALRLAQGKGDVAADAVRRFAARRGAGEVAVLDQLARLYARIRDYDRLGTTLQRLIAIDPGHRDTHVRQLILTRLRHADGGASAAERQAELDALMAQLGDAGGPAFRATVYAQADLTGPAIDQLRRAVAAAPQDGDALARLAAELVRAQRRGEAIALLQYAAERGGQPVAAIDALIDTVTGATDDDGAAAVLGWAERRVLERIAAEGASPRLLGLLADIAAADADVALQVRATEATVAGAGERRGYVLRELATLSGGGVRDGSGVAVIGDPQRKLIYARRLLALGQSFPPDLYADLARTLLSQGDEAGAERAFAMMNGMGGLVNVDEAKGDAYAAAGRLRPALANYARALLQDQDNFDLLVKTAILQERAGQDALAGRWYWRALRTLIARQPARPVDAQDERGLDVRRYYPTLVEGLLLTWPNGTGQADAILADLARQFDAAMGEVDGARPGRFADHPRLALLVDLGRRIVDAGRGNAALSGWDAPLDARFAADPAYRRAATLRRHLTGRGTVLPTGTDWPLAALAVQAGDTDNGELGFVLALARGDDAAADAALATALADEEAARAPGADPSAFRQPLYLLLLVDAMDRMPADRLRDRVLVPLQRSPARDAILFDLFRAAPDRFDRLERINGARLLTPDRLVALTIEQSSRPLGITLRSSRGAGGGDGNDWLAGFSTDQLIALYDGLVVRVAQGQGDSALGDLALDTVSRRPLDAGQQQRLSAILDRDRAVVRDPQTRSGMPLVARLLLFNVAPANRELVLRAARGVAASYGDSAALPTVLTRWYAGDRAGAFVALATMAEAMRSAGQSIGRIDRAIEAHFGDIHRQQIDAFLADPAPRPQDAVLVYDRFVAQDGAASVEQRLAVTRRMITLDPANPRYRLRLLTLLADRADWAALAPPLQAWVTATPDDRTAATMLALVYRLLGQEDAARAVATAAQVDPDDADWLARLLNRARMLSGRSTGSGRLFAPVYDAYRQRYPARPAVIAVQAREGRPAVSGAAGGDGMLAPLLQVDPADPVPPPRRLRALWRQSLPLAAEGDLLRGRRALAQTLLAGTKGNGAAAALLADPAMTAELSAYPRVMAPEDQARQTALYAVGAYGPVRRGAGATALAALLDELRAGRADADLVRRLIALAGQGAAPLAPADLAALDARLRAMPVLGVDDRIALARIVAQGGDGATAEALLRAALLQLLYPAGPLDGVDDFAATLRRIVATLAAWPDVQERRRVHGALAQLLETRKLGPNGGDLPGLPPLDGGGVAAP